VGSLNILLLRLDNTYISFKYESKDLNLDEGFAFSLQNANYAEIIYESTSDTETQTGVSIKWDVGEPDEESSESYSPSIGFIVGVVGGVLFLFIFCTCVFVC
jgi:hypothetical protein